MSLSFSILPVVCVCVCVYHVGGAAVGERGTKRPCTLHEKKKKSEKQFMSQKAGSVQFNYYF
jgi:hypothetical protein